MEINWTKLTEGEPLPPYVVKAWQSKEYYDEVYLVGRVFIGNDVLPATVMHSKRCAYASKNGREYVTSQYEVLVGEHYYWQPSEDGYFPADAADFSTQSTDEQMFIGRVNNRGTVRVGRVDPTQGLIHFPFYGDEVCLRSYDVLTLDNSARWVSASFSDIPVNAVVGGYYRRNIIYLGRALIDGQWITAKIIPSEEIALACDEFRDIPVSDFQILCGSGYTWQKVYNQYIPPNTVITGTTPRGKPLYVGRSHNMGELRPGLISPNRKSIMFCFGEHLRDYEVLVQEF